MIQEEYFKSKYGYNGFEMIIMSVITGFTNFNALPGNLLGIRDKNPHRFFIGTFTMITSFMYHFLESIGVYMFILDEGQWHKLDNIGSIACFIELNNYFMQNSGDVHHFVSWSGLILTLVLQEGYTWEVNYTIAPITIYFIAMIIKKTLVKGPQVIYGQLWRGLFFLAVAIYCFIKGLDEFNDYLRIWHGLWHMFCTTSLFYLFSLYNKDILEIWEYDKIIKSLQKKKIAK